MGASLQIRTTDAALNLGLWQGIYLCENRDHGGSINLVLTAYGV